MAEGSSRQLDTEQLRGLMRSVPDFPVQGITFRDITTLIGDPEGLGSVVSLMAEMAPADYSHIASVEARGFIIGGALADRLGKAFVPVRKKGKLPAETVAREYDLEYGKGVLEIHRDAVGKGDRVWVVDDLLATGGSLAAACALIENIGGVVAGIGVMIELEGLDGWSALPGHEGRSLFKMDA